MWHGPFDNHLEILGLCQRPTILPQGLCLRPTIPASSCSGLCLMPTITASSCSGLCLRAYHPCIIQWRAFVWGPTIHASSSRGPLFEGLPSMHHPVEGLCLRPTFRASSSGGPLSEAYHVYTIWWMAFVWGLTIPVSSWCGPWSEVSDSYITLLWA